VKILLTSLYFAPAIGGIETVSMLLAREFVAAGHTVKVATRTREGNVPDYGFEVLRDPSFSQLAAAMRWCDIFFQSNISTQLARPLLIVRRPWLMVHHTWIPKPHGLSGLNNRLKLFLLRFGHSISISEAVRESLPVDSTVIPNPYEASVFHSIESVERTRVLVALGRLVSDKGFDLLIQALALLAAEGFRPTLTIIGDGPEKPGLLQLAKELKVADQITFAGAMAGNDLAKELNRHGIMVVPSRWKEPFGLVALEGIACGCVPVGSREGGLSDAIGWCGVTFPNGDAAALATELIRLLKSPELLLSYRQHADEHLRKHRPDVVAGRYLEFFARFLHRRAA
jgi:glycogen(starch) synthase